MGLLYYIATILVCGLLVAITQELLALADTVKQFPTMSSQQRSRLLAAALGGAVLALSALLIYGRYAGVAAVVHFAFWLLLPQALLRFRLRAPEPLSAPRAEPQRQELVAFILTCMTLTGYVAWVFHDFRQAWRHYVHQLSRDFGDWSHLLTLGAPPLAALVSWCLGSWWLLRPSSFARRSRMLWFVMLWVCTFGLPESCMLTRGGSHYYLSP